MKYHENSEWVQPVYEQEIVQGRKGSKITFGAGVPCPFDDSTCKAYIRVTGKSTENQARLALYKKLDDHGVKKHKKSPRK